MSLNSPVKKVLQNAGVLLSGNMLANVFGLLSVSIFSRSVGVAMFGYYVLILTYIEVVDKIFNFQTWQAFIKFATDFRYKNESYHIMMLLKYSFIVDFISLIVATFVALSLSFFAKDFFGIPVEYYPLLFLMCFTILFKTSEISTGIFRLYDRFKLQAKISVYGSAIKLLLFGLIAITSPSFERFIYAIVLVQFITMIMKFHFSRLVLKENNILIKQIVKEKINMTLFKELKIFSFIIYNNFDVSVRMVSRQLDNVILGAIHGAEAVGVYKIAKEVANLISKLTDPIYQAIYPEFAALLAAGQNLEAKQLATKISLYAGGAGLIFYGLFVFFGKWVIGLAFGVEFIDSFEVTLVYFLAIYIAVISVPLVPMLFSYGLAKEAFYNQLLATIAYILIIYPLTLLFETIGASIAYIVFYIVWLLLTIKLIKKY